jgi:hypothetical protein
LKPLRTYTPASVPLFDVGITTAEKTMTDQLSLDYFLKSAKQRPTDAYTWCYTILMKHRLKQYDLEKDE